MILYCRVHVFQIRNPGQYGTIASFLFFFNQKTGNLTIFFISFIDSFCYFIGKKKKRLAKSEKLCYIIRMIKTYIINIKQNLDRS